MDVAEKLFDAVDHDDLEKVKTITESEVVSLGIITRGSACNKETLAHVAARRGNLPMLRYLLEKDPSLVEKPNENGYTGALQSRTLLETAIEYDHLNIVKYLVEDHNYDIFTPRHVFLSTSHPSPVTMSISKGRLGILKYFIEEGRLDVETGGPPRDEGNDWYLHHHYEPLLFTAVIKKCHNITRFLIDDWGVSLTTLDEDDENILYNAVRIGDLNLIKYVLDEKSAKIDINGRNKDGQTLVYLAVDSDHLDIVKYLVEQKKANVNHPCLEKKWTPLHLATLCPQVEMLEYLVDHGADINTKNIDGDTPLHLAAALEHNGSRSVLFCKYLIEHGANMKMKNQKGQSPLDRSIAKMNIEASKCFIDHSGDVNQVSDESGTIVHKVATCNQTALLDYVVSVKHANVNILRKKDNCTPLHCAAASDLPEFCKYLIEHGADPRAKNSEGKMPVQLACKKATIVYLQSVAAEKRSRRSANSSFWIPFYQPKLQNSAPQVTSGNMLEEPIASSNGMQAFHVHSFLTVTNFAIRYLFHSYSLTPMVEGSPPDEVNLVAEDAINSFVDFEEDETP